MEVIGKQDIKLYLFYNYKVQLTNFIKKKILFNNF